MLPRLRSPTCGSARNTSGTQACRLRWMKPIAWPARYSPAVAAVATAKTTSTSISVRCFSLLGSARLELHDRNRSRVGVPTETASRPRAATSDTNEQHEALAHEAVASPKGWHCRKGLL